MGVGALTRKNERKGRRHDSQNGGSTGPLYFRGFLGEIRSVGSIRDSFWGLIEPQRVVEPRYIAPEHSKEVPKTAPQVISPASVTSTPVTAE
jgi:hypothetical protein